MHALIRCIYQLLVSNGVAVGYPPLLGGLLVILHLLSQWFTSLETLALLLAQNDNQM